MHGCGAALSAWPGKGSEPPRRRAHGTGAHAGNSSSRRSRRRSFAPGSTRRRTWTSALWFALCTGWFFLMRVGEYAWSNGWDYDKVLTGADVQARVNGCVTANMREADEMVIWFKASKVDQLKAGEARNHYRTGDASDLCPVRALEMLQHHFPERFTVERHLPLCRRADGSPLKREHIQEVLEQAAQRPSLLLHGICECASTGAAAAARMLAAAACALASASTLSARSLCCYFE